ncbi:cell division protein FtsQ/DivIB [Tepidibacillus sp. LV47]|uniref:cell division protein FtsQ/DivIB n=1 Tax=Tepidibacillus sp. LV47 TaxID=3398228 RepID=UPI003AAB7852
MNLEQTIPPYRKRTVKPKGNRRVLKLVLFFFFVLAIIAFFNSSISRITDIQIQGNHFLTEKEIFDQGNLRLNMQYFFLIPSSLQEKLIKLKEIKKVDVQKQFPGHLKITIIEYQPIAYLYQKNNEWLPILENGYLLKKPVKDQYMSGPFITEWKDQKLLPILIDELKKIQPHVLKQISEIRQNGQVDDPTRLLLIMNEGYKVHVPLEKLASQMNLYPSIIENVKGKTTKLGDIYMLESIRFEEFKNRGEKNESE